MGRLAYQDNIQVKKVERDKNSIAQLIILQKDEWTVECARPDKSNKKYIEVRILGNVFGYQGFLPQSYWMEFRDRASAIFNSDEKRFRLKLAKEGIINK